MILVSVVLIIIGAIVLISGIWQLMCKRVLMGEAKEYEAEYCGIEKIAAGRRTVSRHRVYIPDIDQSVHGICPIFRKKNLPEKLKVYYNPQVKNYCSIEMVHDTEYTALTGIIIFVVLLALAIVIMKM